MYEASISHDQGFRIHEIIDKVTSLCNNGSKAGYEQEDTEYYTLLICMKISLIKYDVSFTFIEFVIY